jgi:hypothetical protein
MRRNFYEINKLISTKLAHGDPFSVCRIDNTAGYVMDCLHKGEYPASEFYNRNTVIECGVYPTTVQYGYNIVYKLVKQCMDSCDILGFVDCSGEIAKGSFCKQWDYKDCFFGDDFLIMDPGALLNYSPHFTLTEDPWTKYLAGKKVLVISTHAESIQHQWNKIDQVWGKHREKIVPFDLAGVIRSPFHPFIDNRQYPGCATWVDSVNYIKGLIDTYDYDVLLAGATTSSPLYIEHAKSRGKVGIQTGGTIQLFFGLLGYRWTQVEGYAGWKQMYNEHWIYPLKQDEAQQREQIRFLESQFAYWK